MYAATQIIWVGRDHVNIKYLFRRYFISTMPFSPTRFNGMMELKGITQHGLAENAGIAQSQVSDCKKGICRTSELTEKIARALDCTPDFLLGWSFPGVDDDADAFRSAVSRLAFDVFEARIAVGNEQKDRCRRVLGHPAAPLTADAWAILAEQIELAVGPTNGGKVLRTIKGGNAS